MLKSWTKSEQYCTACAMAVLLGFLVVALYLSPQVGNADNQTNSGGNNSVQQPDEWHRWTDPLAVMTFFLSLGTFYLAYATRGLVKLTADEFSASHAPHIRVKSAILMNDIWEGEKIKVRVAIVNTGNTSAQIFLLHIVTVLAHADRELPNQTDLPPESSSVPTPSPFNLPSGITLVLPDQTDGRILSGTDCVAIREGLTNLYVLGRVEYRDGAGRVKTTAYCRVLNLRAAASVNERGRLRKHPDPDYDYED